MVEQAAVEPVEMTAPATATPVVDAPAMADAAPAAEAVEVPQAPVSLLETFDAEQKAKEPAPEAKPEAKAEDKPAEPVKDAPKAEEKVEAKDPAKDEPKAEEPKAEPAKIEWKYEAPEGISLDDATKGQLNEALEAARTGDAQKLMDLHAKAATDYAEQLSREQWRVWDETRKNWVKEVMADPEIGGSGFQTSMGAIARMRDMLVSDKDRPAFEEFLRVTGAGDHPQFLKLLHNAARFYDEPALPPPNPKPPADIGSGGKGERRAVMYSHPRSRHNGA